LLAAGILIPIIHFHVQCPRRDIKTAGDLFLWQKPDAPVARGEIRGAVYYMVRGPYERIFPSDTSAYIFDNKGNLVDWTTDFGDYRSGLVEIFYQGKFPKISVTEFMSEIGMTNTVIEPAAGADRLAHPGGSAALSNGVKPKITI
jgi:hypothetical protein